MIKKENTLLIEFKFTRNYFPTYKNGLRVTICDKKQPVSITRTDSHTSYLHIQSKGQTEPLGAARTPQHVLHGYKT